MKKIHYSRAGYDGNYKYTSVCGKQVKTHQANVDTTVDPEEANCKQCLATAKWADDYGHSTGTIKTTIKRRIYIESDILHTDEFHSAQRDVAKIADSRQLKYVERVFSQVIEYAWHELEKTWKAVKLADEVYATSSLVPLIGGSYSGAPVIFNGMCERAIKENITGKQIYILNKLDNIHWDMIDFKLMKKAFKENDLYMYDNDYKMTKIDTTKIKEK